MMMVGRRGKPVREAAESVEALTDELLVLVLDLRRDGKIEFDVKIPVDGGPLLNRVIDLLGLQTNDEVKFTVVAKMPPRK